MEEICIKVDIPPELKDKFESVLIKATEKLVKSIEFSMADELLKDSKLTDEDCLRLGDELKRRVAKRHGL